MGGVSETMGGETMGGETRGQLCSCMRLGPQSSALVLSILLVVFNLVVVFIRFMVVIRVTHSWYPSCLLVLHHHSHHDDSRQFQ